MKVVLISSGVLPVFPKGYGGLEAVVGDLAVCLDRLGHEVYVVAPEGSDIGGGGKINHISCGPCDPDARGWEARAYELYASILLDQRFKDAIIHDHTWAKYIYLLKMEYPELHVLSTLHGMLPYQTPPPVEHPNIVGISKHHAQSIADGLKITTRHVYNGIDLHQYPFSKDHGERYLFLARMTPFKGAHIFVQAIRQLGLTGDLVGDDTMVEDKEFVSRLMLECAEYGKIRYWGGVSRSKAADLFGKAKCYVLPNTAGWQEPFGLTVVEAMACGCPVVATRSGAIPELVTEETGYLADTVEDLPSLLDGDKITAIDSWDCRNRAELFSRESMAISYAKLYKEILDGGGW